MANSIKKALAKSNAEHSDNYNHLAMIEDPSSIAAESYRRVKVGLEYSEVDKKIQVIQVCSAIQGEGKTTTALNIAATYAEGGKKVCIIDLDLRRPKLHRVLKVENKNGITDVLTGNISLDDAIKHADGIPFDVINRGTKSPYPTAILGSEELKNVFGQLRKKYDTILVDCPPILAVSDAVVISKNTDGCVFIISQEQTDKAVAKEAVKALKANNVDILGCVVTGITKKAENYYNGYKYHYYYQNYKDDKKA